MNKIVGIGANVIDTLITVSAYPSEDTKLRADGVKECGGGPCATGLVAASKLGESAAYIGALAKDSGGEFLLRDMERFGMSNEYVTVEEGKSSFASYVILNTSNASRTCVFNKNNLPDFVIDANRQKAIEDAEILMVDGNELDNAVKGAEIARKSGTKVLYDAGGLYPDVEKLLALTDILIPSEEFALAKSEAETAEDAAKILFERYKPEFVIITQGVKGGVLYDGENITRYPSFKVDAVDSNGAGDVFHGAFAAATVKGYSPYESCIFASAVSALKCTKVGARDGVPGYEETLKFLEENGHYEFEKNLD